MKEGILQCVFKSAKRLHMDWLSDIIQQSNSDPSRAPTMELEFEGIPVHEQIDMYINGTRGDFYAYTEMPWDLPYNGNEGLDLSSFSLELDEAPSEKAKAEDSDLLLMQASNSESPDVKQLQQDSNDNDCPPTNSTRIHCISSQGKLCSRSSNDDAAKKSESSSNNHQSQPESGPKRKAKLCWTPELHGLFVKAVEQLGHDRAVPTKILELMDIPSLNRHHIASHLQKYRSSIRGLHGKPRKTQQRMCCNTKRSHVLKSCPAKVERPHSYAPAYNVPFWPPTHFSVPPAEAFSMQMCNRQAADPWLLQQSNYKSSVHATALGTAVYEQSLVGFPTQLHDCEAEFKEAVCSVDFEAHINSTAMCLRPKAAAVEEAIRQVMNQRCSQLPIGLTPPSAESLTAELLKQRVPHEVLTSSSDF